MSDDTFLETDASCSRAGGEGAGQMLIAIGQTLQQAPDDKRYDVTVTVEEYDDG